MTTEQEQFILNLLKQLSVNSTNPDAIKTIEMVQSIIKELDEQPANN